MTVPLHVAQQKKKQEVMLPLEVQLLVDATIAWLIQVQKEDYHNEMKPFSQVAEQTKIKGQEYFAQLFSELCHAQTIIQEEFSKQEKVEHESYAEEASLAAWEKAIEMAKQKILTVPLGTTFFDLPNQFEKPIHEEIGLTWEFMDRLYKVAQKLYDEKRFQESREIYQLLRFLHPNVFAYWFGAGRVEHALGNNEEALQMFITSLVSDTTNPDAFFQMASCYFDLNEIECCRRALDFCIQYAKEDPARADLIERAKHIQESLPMQKAA